MDATVEIVGFGLALPILLSFIWLLLLRIAAKTITYLLILLVGILGFLITIYFFVLVNDRKTFSLDSFEVHVSSLVCSRATCRQR